jgi:uncharacterized protein (TIGR03435 family)
MKKLMLWMISLAALSGTALNAQNLTGTWQGTLSPGAQTLRIVVKVSIGADDKPKAVMYSIDQGAQPINASAVSREGSTVKMTVPALNGSYEGKLSADGDTITGTWTQGAPLPLNLSRATPATEWTIPEPPPPPKTMSANAKPKFEVATIKPSENPQGFGFTVNRSGWLTTHNTTLTDLIKISFGLHPKQITGGASWMETDKYDVVGKPDTEGIPSITQLMAMVQQMLPDRFQLKFHREKKELSAYVLTVGKSGIKIDEETSNPNGLPGFGGGGPRGLNVRNATMQEFAEFLQANVLDQPVVDQTGLGKKRFDFVLKWTPDGQQGATGAAGGPKPEGAPAEASADAPPDIYLAMQQQLGLKLESTKAPVDLFVIDHVEKPSEN